MGGDRHSIAMSVTRLPGSRILSLIPQSVSAWYRGVVGNRLAEYGLKLDDVLIEDGYVSEALDRLPHEQRVLRQMRLKRASDLSMKHDVLAPHVVAAQRPFEGYLDLETARVAIDEKKLIE